VFGAENAGRLLVRSATGKCYGILSTISGTKHTQGSYWRRGRDCASFLAVYKKIAAENKEST